VPLATDPGAARRILVYGATGSGKSTAAARISDTTGLPLTLADELAWQPGWALVDEQVQRELFARVAGAERWVLDTAYATWLDVVLPRVDLVVALDYPRWFSLQRLLRRTFARAIDKRPICNGNSESWRGVVSRESIIAWHFRSFPRKRRRMRAWAAAAEGPPVLIVRRPRDLERWLRRLVD
jgi:adenylate kinase family enzyme